MSNSGNRSHPNSVRTGGVPDDGPANPVRSDLTGRTQAPTKSPRARDPTQNAGSHQESRDHNKHNNPGQSGHSPQKHNAAEEKK